MLGWKDNVGRKRGQHNLQYRPNQDKGQQERIDI